MISQLDPNKYIQSLESWDRAGSERTRMVQGTLTESKNPELEKIQETVKVYYNVGGALEMSLEWR